MRGELPGEFEQVVLLVLAGFDRDATGREVYDTLTSTTGRDVSVAAIHITLARMHEKLWVDCRTTDPAPGEGGKPRRRYSLAPAGAALLSSQRAQLEQLWGRASAHPLIDGRQA